MAILLSLIFGEVFMLKKMLIVVAALGAALLGVLGFYKNSKKLRLHRMLRKTGQAMYNVGTMLRVLSMQSVSG